MEDILIPLEKVMERVGLKRTDIYQRMKRGEFPRQVILSKKAVRWSNNEISAWIAAQLDNR